MVERQFFQQVIHFGICSVIGLSALGFGYAPSASAMVIGKEINLSHAVMTASTGNTAPTAVKPAVSQVSQADKLIAIGRDFLGVKYQYGAASGSTKSFDCSSYTQYIFKQIGITLPRTSSAQATVGAKVAKSSLQTGSSISRCPQGR